ncbi:MAG: metallophosphoesterase [Ktedonobacterales bacterium]
MAGTLGATNPPEVVRVAAVADIHVSKATQSALQTLLAQVAEQADLLVIAGDLTDYGQPEEARLLAHELNATLKKPVVAVLGNHDHELGHQEEIKTILCDAGVNVLDGDVCEMLGIGFAGVKGFGGGFDHHSLAPWGEKMIKCFVHEAVEEALKLEAALARLHQPQRVALMHYSPIRATVEGEPLEIFPFLGSSRLEEPLTRYPVQMALHGHAHHGQPEGRTASGIPVYNVAAPVLKAAYPDRPTFRLIEVRNPRPPTETADETPTEVVAEATL